MNLKFPNILLTTTPVTESHLFDLLVHVNSVVRLVDRQVKSRSRIKKCQKKLQNSGDARLKGGIPPGFKFNPAFCFVYLRLFIA